MKVCTWHHEFCFSGAGKLGDWRHQSSQGWEAQVRMCDAAWAGPNQNGVHLTPNTSVHTNKWTSSWLFSCRFADFTKKHESCFHLENGRILSRHRMNRQPTMGIQKNSEGFNNKGDKGTLPNCACSHTNRLDSKIDSDDIDMPFPGGETLIFGLLDRLVATIPCESEVNCSS